MTDPSVAVEKLKEEDARQAREILAAISEVIEAHGKRMIAEGRSPMMNAVVGALAAESGKAIASVEPKYRRYLQQRFDSTVRIWRRHFEQARMPACSTLDLSEPRQ